MLPIHEALPRLEAALAQRNAAVLVAPPGAGKTTVVPLALLQAPWAAGRKVVVLEPRRLAARAAAARMASTLGEPVGATVGYRVRLDAKVSAATRVEVVTEGVFTRMILDDPALEGVAAVLFDEFHERSLEGDTGLALARALKPHAILLDVMMPGIDGWSVLSALKAEAALADIPVIMVTFVEQRALAASLGAADYIMKPVHWEKFRSVMDRYRPIVSDVLIIEDDADTRARMRRIMERDGWVVAEAENGQAGLDRLAVNRPGIVLLDLTMPIMDGFEFLRQMRTRPECADVPVVVLTALDLTGEDRRRLRGASQILHKGDVSLQALAERLRELSFGAEGTATQALDAA